MFFKESNLTSHQLMQSMLFVADQDVVGVTAYLQHCNDVSSMTPRLFDLDLTSAAD